MAVSKSKVVAVNVVDKRMSAYADILTTEQASEIGERPAEGSKLRDITDNLLLNWRSASYVAGMPPQFVYGPKAVLESFTSAPVGDTQLLAVTEAILASFAQLVPELVDEPSLRRKLLQAVLKRAADFRDAREKSKFEFPLEQTWQEYLATPAFHQYVWSSERLSYQAIYNAYEDFLVECVRVANALDRCRTSDREFPMWCSDAFGKKTYQAVWTAAPVDRIRLVRHSLAHASGGLTKPLKDKRIKIRTHNGAIQVWPGDVRDAIAVLGPCILKVIDAASALPEFA